MKLFTSADAPDTMGKFESMPINYPADLVHCPLWWHKQGLQKTASGYGAKIESAYKINFNGKLYRIYHTCYGNASSAWFTVRGRRIYVS